MRTRLVLAALALAVGLAAATSADPLPAPPDWATSTILSTLRHGVQLLSEGDFERAEGHLRGALPPKPSRVYINVSCAPPGRRDQAAKSAREALAAWNAALPELVEFVESDVEEDAHVLIQFEYDVAARRDGEVRFVCGMTHAKAAHSGKGIKRSAVVRVSVFGHGAGSHLHKPESLVHVTGHELGHFLGLGESSDIADIMGPDSHKGNPATRPSEADIGRLEALADISERLLEIARRAERVAMPGEWKNAKPAAQHGAADPHAQ